MSLYRDLIIELYKNPVNKGEIAKPTFTHSGANVTCGDRVRVYVKLADDKKTIEKMTFEGEGCAISVAAASIITEEVVGKTLEEVAAWSSGTICDFLGTDLGPSRIKCGLLALETLQEGAKR